ncbi:hypothetical protein K501DRAFT_323036 [Backusella circina FSU 941]|nr:hypothetical protein K501DRAFT_323036 [Backusella circina FSU 941]
MEKTDEAKAGHLTCHWKDCGQFFPDHTSLASHLSEDHVGWKRGGYYCEWTNCARQGAKCHNRFALMMHLRIHTGEKPFECTYPNCGQTFGRMDALVRHKKAEHGEDTILPEKGLKPSSMSHHHQRPRNNKAQKRPANTDLNSKGKRRRFQELTGRVSADWSSSDDSDDSLAELDDSTIATATKLDNKLGSSSSSSSDYSQYRLAKAQLHYILRENEMLQDEYESTQKKLKRMRTERRVLLDAVMAAELKSKRRDLDDPALYESDKLKDDA